MGLIAASLRPGVSALVDQGGPETEVSTDYGK